MVAQTLHGADAEFLAACYDATGGNGFLVNELVGELVRREIEPRAANAALADGLTIGRCRSLGACAPAQACPRSAPGWPAPSRCWAEGRSRAWRPGWPNWTTPRRGEPPTTSPRRRSCSRDCRSCSSTRWYGQRSTGSWGWASACSGTAARLHCCWPPAPSPIGWPCTCSRRRRAVTPRPWTCSGWRPEPLASAARRMWLRPTCGGHWQSRRTRS